MSKAKYKLVAKRWQQAVPVTLVVNATPSGGMRVEELRKANVLPFLPRAGDELAVGWDGDYMTVETVFWCPDDGIAVWFCDRDGLERLERLVGDGWEVA